MQIMKKITNNLGLKIISVICAFILWLIVVNIDDPVVSKQYTGIEVSVKNETVIKNQGQTYDILDDTNIITVTVKAKRSLLSNLRKSDFEAVADMEEIMYDGYVPISVSCSNPQISADDIVPNIRNMKISIENMETKQLAVMTSTTGTPADGYAIGKIKISPNVVRITGPQSVVGQVNKVMVMVDVDRCSSDLDTKIKPELYDANDQLITNSRLTISEKKISVQVQILETKSVPLEFSIDQTTKNGYRYNGIEYNPETVLIKGEHSVLAGIDSIQIPSTAFDISEATEDVEEAIDVTKYLPEGAELYDADAANIAVTIHIEAIQQKTITIPVGNITINGLPEGYEIEFLNGENVEVEISGTSADVLALTEDQIVGEVDVSGYEEGQVALPVNWTFPEGISQVSATLLWMNIKRTEPQVTVTEEPEEEETSQKSSKTSKSEASETGSKEKTSNTKDNTKKDQNSSEKKTSLEEEDDSAGDSEGSETQDSQEEESPVIDVTSDSAIDG